MKKGLSSVTRWVVVFALVLGSLQYTATEAEAATGLDAEADTEIASLATGPIVRRQLLHRSGRFEIQPMVAFSANDAFVRNVLPGVSGAYFLNNVFGLGGSFNFGALQLDTSLRRNLEATVPENRLNTISYARFNWTMDAGLIYVPMFGKFSVMNTFFTHYDVHVMGGMALISDGSLSAQEGMAGDPGLSGVRPGGMLGAGVRFFLGDMISLNFQMRNYVTTRAEISSGSASPQLGNTVILSGGVGIYLPGEVKISR